ncbi:MAG TPA: peptidoglycan DD-metalloendopeptidase family protein [Actinomycetota bacterium]|nr:peptidoglycan DD-metalloendopeptidase family protein [Actinomycetota bacterium]
MRGRKYISRARVGSARRPNRAARGTAAALLLVTSAVTVLGGVAASEETPEDLRARMADIQADLDATTQELEDLHADEERLESELQVIETKISTLKKREKRLTSVVAERADELYRSGSTGMVEMLMNSESIAELSDKAEILSRASLGDTSAFVEMARTQDELALYSRQLAEKQETLAATEERKQAAAERLQAQFDAVAADYAALQRELARVEPVSSAPAPAPVSATSSIPSTNGKACPVGQPHSFIDSWGYPRSGGRSHEGVDIMASYGTPVYAIVSGTITYAGYGDSAGNWQILSGSDGNAYWYMHNQSNIVTGGSVKAGQQIATVGDTGNASGVPHLHFEYHPGGGGPVNPYPLAAAVC